MVGLGRRSSISFFCSSISSDVFLSADVSCFSGGSGSCSISSSVSDSVRSDSEDDDELDDDEREDDEEERTSSSLPPSSSSSLRVCEREKPLRKYALSYQGLEVISY